MSERLHKLLAQHGMGSRRQVEDWIREGRVLVNGRAAEIGQQVETGDKVVVDGRDVTRLLSIEQRLRVIVYHKPTGEMMKGQEGDEREGVEMRLPKLHGGRWVAINALGFGEDGLLILANEGAFASAIAKRVHEMPVEYRVRALKPTLEEDWPEMPLSVEMDAGTVSFSAVEPAGTGALNLWFRVAADRTVPRGAVRALFDAAGLKVSRVMLVQWGPMKLPRDLPRGRSRDVEGEELEALSVLAGRPAKPAREKPVRGRSSRRAGPRTGRKSGGQ
jgi:23S rRNA pseudouridine2605 synthase